MQASDSTIAFATSGPQPSVDSAAIGAALERDGFFVSGPVLDSSACRTLARLYDVGAAAFRSTVSMQRHGFGQGEYKYFARPLPPLVLELRCSIYAALVPVANAWGARLGLESAWPPHHEALAERCAAAGQGRPTPLLLRYGPGDYNCLHQDLYGAIHFPLQAIVLLDRPEVDFEGGELILVEQRPRRQSRPMVVPLVQGAIAVIPVRERPVASARGSSRVLMRHGVSVVRRGLRRTLGLIFHDAA